MIIYSFLRHLVIFEVIVGGPGESDNMKSSMTMNAMSVGRISELKWGKSDGDKKKIQQRRMSVKQGKVKSLTWEGN